MKTITISITDAQYDWLNGQKRTFKVSQLMQKLLANHIEQQKKTGEQ